MNSCCALTRIRCKARQVYNINQINTKIFHFIPISFDRHRQTNKKHSAHCDKFSGVFVSYNCRMIILQWLRLQA